MKIIKIILLCIATSTLTNCASGYRMIEPKTINYVSTDEKENVKLEYKYELLDKKYAKKEENKDTSKTEVKKSTAPFAVSNATNDIKFTAYKTTDKVGVAGWFQKVDVKNLENLKH